MSYTGGISRSKYRIEQSSRFDSIVKEIEHSKQFDNFTQQTCQKNSVSKVLLKMCPHDPVSKVPCTTVRIAAQGLSIQTWTYCVGKWEGMWLHRYFWLAGSLQYVKVAPDRLNLEGSLIFTSGKNSLFLFWSLAMSRKGSDVTNLVFLSDSYKNYVCAWRSY
jgi:hypothetical protein